MSGDFEGWQIALGVGLVFVGTLFAGSANILIKVKRNAAAEGQRRGSWPVIILCYIIDGGLKFTAFTFAPMSLLAPVSAMTIIVNAVLARLVLGERLSPVNRLGTAVIVFGVVGAVIVSSSQHKEDRTYNDWLDILSSAKFILFLAINLPSLAFLAFFVAVASRIGHRSVSRVTHAGPDAAVDGVKADPGPVSIVVGGGGGGDDDDAGGSGRNVDGGAGVVAVPSTPIKARRPAGDGGGDDGGGGDDDGSSSSSGAAAGPNGGVAVVSVLGGSSRGVGVGRGATAASSPAASSKPSRAVASSPAHASRASIDRVSRSTVVSTIMRLPTELVERAVKRTAAGSLTRALVYATLTAGVGAWTGVIGKFTAEMIKLTVQHEDEDSSEEGEKDRAPAYVIVLGIVGILLCAGGQLKSMSAQMHAFNATLIIPIYQSLFIGLNIIYGIFVYSELDGFEGWRIAVLAIAVLISGLGIHLVSRKDVTAMPVPDADEAESAATAAADDAVMAAGRDRHDGRELSLSRTSLLPRPDETEAVVATDAGNADARAGPAASSS